MILGILIGCIVAAIWFQIRYLLVIKIAKTYHKKVTIEHTVIWMHTLLITSSFGLIGYLFKGI